MTPRADVRELRSFGLVVGGVFLGIGLWPLVIRGASARWWAVTLGAALIGAGLMFPRVLGPARAAWMALADLLGRVNSRLLLGLVFFTLVTPMAIVLRIRGRDPLNRGFDRAATTYRAGRRPRPNTHMLRQY